MTTTQRPVTMPQTEQQVETFYRRATVAQDPTLRAFIGMMQTLGPARFVNDVDEDEPDDDEEDESEELEEEPTEREED